MARHTAKFVQLLKTERAVGCPITLSSTMSARRRRPDGTETSTETSAPKRVKPSEFDTCIIYAVVFNLIFDPKRVLLRRLFFIDGDWTIYVFVGFYPYRDYQPFAEFRSVKKNGLTILILDNR